jgi:putative DNA primase/helicase
MTIKTIDAARGRWVGILAHFGIDAALLGNKHGPCPLCQGKTRFRFDDKEGNGTWICNQCGAGTGMSLLMQFKGWDFKTAAKEVDAIIGAVPQVVTEVERRDPLIRLRKVASGLRSMGGINPVRLYLKSRGLSPTSEIKFHPGIEHWDNDHKRHVFPAMVCLLESPTGKALSYHVTALTPSGAKANVDPVKKILPAVDPLPGAAIRLTKIYDHIAIAEGIETALAVMAKYKIPCWAASNAPLLEKFIPPEGIREVSIFGDNDRNFTGQKAAYTLANRLAKTMRVSVHIPTVAGSDFADAEDDMPTDQQQERPHG